MRIARQCALVILGLLAANSATSTSQTVPAPDYSSDPRIKKIQHFFVGFDSPGYVFAEDFLLAADRNRLDWRLLPSLSLLESGGGKNFRNNNILGWDSCRRQFPSVTACIHHVALQLAASRLYRDKSLNGKLALYNPNHHYPQRVKALMQQIDRDPGGLSGKP